MLACLDYPVQESNRTYGTYVGVLNTGRVGTSGHSRGGGGSIMAGRDDRVRPPRRSSRTPSASAMTRPRSATSAGRCSSCPAGGHHRRALPQCAAGLCRANVPIFWGERRYVSHFEPVGNGGEYRGPSTARFRYQLMDDQSARSTFYGRLCRLCTSLLWSVERKGIGKAGEAQGGPPPCATGWPISCWAGCGRSGS